MSTNQQYPDYELEDEHVVSSPQQVKAIFDEFRGTLLELLLQRAATVQELAAAVERPKSTVAYHVGLLTDVGVLKVVRTRKVRGIQERFYGRTARIFYIGGTRPEHPELMPNYITTAADESAPAHRDDTLRAIKRYAWISAADAEQFWHRVFALVNEYAQLPRSTDDAQAYAFLTALYPTEHPRLLDPED